MAFHINLFETEERGRAKSWGSFFMRDREADGARLKKI